MIGEDVRLVEHHQAGDEMTPYERLFGDALRGDRTLFGERGRRRSRLAHRRSRARAADLPLYEYDAGSRGPIEAERLVAGAGGWLDPDITQTR